MRFKIQLQVTIEVEAEDGREALPIATGYLDEAIDWALEHYVDTSIISVEWDQGTLKGTEDE